MFDAVLRLPSWSLWCVLVAASVASLELGYWWGARRRHLYDEASLGQLSVIQTGVFGTLGLILAFVLSIVLAHFDQRRALVVAEANAIGTCYLRTSFLRDEERTEGQLSLKRYVRLRLDAFEQRNKRVNDDWEFMDREASAIRQRLWSVAERATQQDSRPLMNLFVASLNELIDLDTSRKAALESHVPGLVTGVLLSFAMLSMTIMAFVSAARCGRRLGMWYFLAALLCSLLLLIIDLDRPRLGLVPVNHEAMYIQERSM